MARRDRVQARYPDAVGLRPYGNVHFLGIPRKNVAERSFTASYRCRLGVTYLPSGCAPPSEAGAFH